MARMEAEHDPHTAHDPRVVRSRRLVMAVITTAVIGGAIAVRTLSTNTAEAQAPSRQATPSEPQKPLRAPEPQHDVMAIVNGQDVSRPALAQACVERYGEDVLEALVNKRLIEHHCKNRGVTITNQEIEAEIDRMAKRFKLGREQWLGLLQDERGVKPEEYKRDILWPTIALRKLAAKDLVVADAEIKKAYESRYGAAVQVRLIVVEDQQRAKALQRQLSANPNDFARLAMQESVDVNSASIGGLIQPIRPYIGEPTVERAAFALQPGQVSQVLPVGEQFALLKCESHLPPRKVSMEAIRSELEEGIREEKLRGVASNLFEKLQNAATIKNVYNDPQLSQSMPGVVATVNGESITMLELGKECLARHGEEVLDGHVSRMLLEQELKKLNVTVSNDDLRGEMSHAAQLAGVVGPSGQPDLAKWAKVAPEEQGVSYEVYVRDSVWPSAALKKLTRDKVQVTQEDMEKGFEANFGERVRVRAIVLGEMRRAQEVWEKARGNASMDFFGDLAEEYSIEPTSRALRGEVPPLRKFGGQPQLEQVAFELAEGELSGIVQVGDKFVILKSEGRTEPVEVTPDEVKDTLYPDLYEKKLRIAMAERYEEIRKSARIDNYLAGTSQAPPAQRSAEARRDTNVRQTGAVR
ncbi:Foldase protein PrsA 3 precursor [Posidoniimonas polymericola]|uniref:peptidylprolyl isomerase n=1 Tax=Posidoniimonas polymericola TaxID=2528002 RepID=A0A5C5YHR2_9BACT|nr:peptidylprolyl isomerase [Posidoniimonas polymericola]TWT74455.1 Foldase protein PrsA 3 precursor [Posidoniimonas polymericola]